MTTAMMRPPSATPALAIERTQNRGEVLSSRIGEGRTSGSGGRLLFATRLGKTGFQLWVRLVGIVTIRCRILWTLAGHPRIMANDRGQVTRACGDSGMKESDGR